MLLKEASMQDDERRYVDLLELICRILTYGLSPARSPQQKVSLCQVQSAFSLGCCWIC